MTGRAEKLVISVKETNPNPFDGAELRHPEGSRRQAEIAGKYAGGVFCNLPDGVVVMCSYSFHYDDASFAIGDKVIVMLQRYDFGKSRSTARSLPNGDTTNSPVPSIGAGAVFFARHIQIADMFKKQEMKGEASFSENRGM